MTEGLSLFLLGFPYLLVLVAAVSALGFDRRIALVLGFVLVVKCSFFVLFLVPPQVLAVVPAFPLAIGVGVVVASRGEPPLAPRTAPLLVLAVASALEVTPAIGRGIFSRGSWPGAAQDLAWGLVSGGIVAVGVAAGQAAFHRWRALRAGRAGRP